MVDKCYQPSEHCYHSNRCPIAFHHYNCLATVAKCNQPFLVVFSNYCCLATVAMLVGLICNRTAGCDK